MSISENLAKIAPTEDIRELPIAIFLADLIARMNWDPDQFHLFRECDNLYIEIKARLRVVSCLQDYNYAYQVKLVIDALKAVWLID